MRELRFSLKRVSVAGLILCMYFYGFGNGKTNERSTNGIAAHPTADV